MHDAVSLESQGRATAVIVTTEFVLEAETQRDALGMAGLEAVVIPHPLSSLTDEEIGQRIDQALPQIERVWLTGKAGTVES
jgi:pseudouridine-5'-phosphate glycosidase